MSYEQIVILVGAMIIAATLAICIPLAIRDAKKYVPPPTIEERLAAYEPDIKTFQAEVIDIACGVYMDDGQFYTQPKAVKEFCVKFRDGDGNIHNVLIPEELYDAFEIGQHGTLTLIDGNLSSFVLDEDEAQ